MQMEELRHQVHSKYYLLRLVAQAPVEKSNFDRTSNASTYGVIEFGQIRKYEETIEYLPRII